MSYHMIITGSPRLLPDTDPKKRITEQHHEPTHNPRKLMQAAQEHSVAAAMMSNPGFYINDGEMPDYRQTLDIFIRARQALSDLPEAISRRFRTARELVSFLGSESNREEAIRLGLLPAKPADPGPSDTDRIIDAIGKISPANGGGQGGAR